MFERTATKHLNTWLKKKRRKPLILRGARQVGKSTLVRMFAQSSGLKLHEINLERNLYLNDIFKKLDTELILRELEALSDKIHTANSILFLDEIQATPYALQALRYLYEDHPELAVVAAGSLLEFTLSDHNFSMPVGRIEYYHLHPFSFKEYLGAISPRLLAEQNNLSIHTPLLTTVHNQLLKKLREYFFVGGLPEAVLAFSEDNSISDVVDVHRSISATYQDDFAKYAKKNDLLLLQKVFNAIPRCLSRKIKYSNISPEDKSNRVKTAITLLTNARICHRVHHSHASGRPLAAERAENTYKLIFIDIGLANHVCGIDWRAINQKNNIQLVNEGGMAEQFIGQQLLDISKGLDPPALYYWLREKKSANAEVDYIIEHGQNIFPVEVKAGKSGSLKSIQQFAFIKNAPVAIRFDLNPPGVQNICHTIRTKTGNKKVSFTLISLPLYAVSELDSILNEYLTSLTPTMGYREGL